MNRWLSDPGDTPYQVRLATWAVLFVVASVIAGLLFLALMGLVGVGSSLLKVWGDVGLSYAALDRLTIGALAVCAVLGLLAFVCMAWGANAAANARRPHTDRPLTTRGQAARALHQRQRPIKVWVNKSA